MKRYIDYRIYSAIGYTLIPTIVWYNGITVWILRFTFWRHNLDIIVSKGDPIWGGK